MLKIIAPSILIFSLWTQAQENSRYKPLKTFVQSLNLIEENHPQTVKRSKIIDGAIQGMLFELDPYSSLLNYQETQDFNQQNSNSRDSIGISVAFNPKKELIVLSVIPQSEAFKKGVQPGDQITHIQKQSILNQSFESIRSYLTNKKNKSIKLKIKRKKISQPLIFDIPLSRIKAPSVRGQKINDYFFYVQIFSFKKTTFQEFKDILRVQPCFLKKLYPLCSKVQQGLLLDLRQNPGGIVDQSLMIADLFLSQGVLTTIKGRKKEYTQTFNAKKIGTLKHFPVVVLIDQYSASASEILASALKENHRALVVGEKSFGKGAVQNLFPIDKEYTLKLTVSYYHTPQGHRIEQIGLSPHINLKTTQNKKIPSRFKNKKLKKNQNKKYFFKRDSLWEEKETEDPSLKEATALLFQMVQ